MGHQSLLLLMAVLAGFRVLHSARSRRRADGDNDQVPPKPAGKLAADKRRRGQKRPKRAKVSKEAKVLRKRQYDKAKTGSAEKQRNCGMKNYVILLYYKYVALSDSEINVVMSFHRAAEAEFSLSGRVRIGKEGINGTVAADPIKIAAYREKFEKLVKLQGTEFKVSRARLSSPPFPTYHLRQVSEIIRLGVDAPIEGRAAHISPQKFHELAQKTKEYTLLDVRNYYESEIGHFASAVRTCTRTFDELPQWVDKNLDMLKKKPLLMYCTGGIRCERASSLLKARGVEIKGQLHGGIHEYLEWSDAPLFKGRNFVFDRRMVTERASGDIVGKCANCKGKHDIFDRANRCKICSSLVLLCELCVKQMTQTQKRERLDMRCAYCVTSGIELEKT